MPNSSSNKVVLVPDARNARSPVRRYRLARIALNPEPGAARDGFEHLKRTYD